MDGLYSSAGLLDELFSNWTVNEKMFFSDINIENLRVKYTLLILSMELFEEQYIDYVIVFFQSFALFSHFQPYLSS